MDSLCLFYDPKTFYQCVKCMKAVCNHPICSTKVPEDTEGYGEDPPKQVSKCNNCVKSKDPKFSVVKNSGIIDVDLAFQTQCAFPPSPIF